MYADGYSRRTKFDPGSMGLALLLNGTIVAGLVAFAAPKIFTRHFDPEVHTFNVPPDPPPPPPTPEPPKPDINHQVQAKQIEVVIPKTIVTTTPDDTHYIAPPTEPTPVGTGGDGGFVTPVRPPPVMTGARRDPRFADSFQPDYPVGERRAEHQGRVVVRVLIGVDGRVKQVVKVSAPSDAFFEATERRALEKWRFKPATRDGVAIETWDEIGVKFVLNDA
jgi:protein TonB